MKEGEILVSLPKDPFISPQLRELRRKLIDHFINEQKITPNYLLLTRRSDQQLPTPLVVAEKWAQFRPRTGTLLDEEKAAEFDLMYAAERGNFPGLLWICDRTSVELLDCFDPAYVEELAARDIGPGSAIDFDPWCESENTALMPPAKWAHMRSQGGLEQMVRNGPDVNIWRGMLWAPREEVVSFLTVSGVDPAALPPDWCEASRNQSVSRGNGPKPAFASTRKWNERDEPHFKKMKELLSEGRALSVADAARKVVKTGDVAGTGSPVNIQKRLERGFSHWKDA